MKRIEDLSRRELLKLFGLGVGAVIADPAAWPRNVQAQSKKITPRGSARNVIFIQNCGAMSQNETFDFAISLIGTDMLTTFCASALNLAGSG